MKTKNIITWKQVKSVLSVRQNKTIASYIKKGLLPEPDKREGSVFFDYDEVCKKLNVSDFKEPFLLEETVRKMLGLNHEKLSEKYCLKHGIPHIRLSYFRGSKLLFRRSELEIFLETKIKVKWNGGLLNEKGRLKFMFDLLNSIFPHPENDSEGAENIKQKLFSFPGAQLPYESFWELLFGKKLLEEIAPTNHTNEHKRQLMWKMIRRSRNVVGKLLTEIGDLRKRIVVADQLEQVPIPIEDLGLGVRPYNICRLAEIENLDQLTQKTGNDLLKYRNFGKKSLAEIKEKLAERGLSLKK